MAELAVTPSLRQGLNPRQAETVERLLVAGEAELDEVGPDALTIRTVAQRAGVSPATAYTYLASKHHLFAELFWRRLVTDPGPEPTGAFSEVSSKVAASTACLGNIGIRPRINGSSRSPASRAGWRTGTNNWLATAFSGPSRFTLARPTRSTCRSSKGRESSHVPPVGSP